MNLVVSMTGMAGGGASYDLMDRQLDALHRSNIKTMIPDDGMPQQLHPLRTRTPNSVWRIDARWVPR